MNVNLMSTLGRVVQSWGVTFRGVSVTGSDGGTVAVKSNGTEGDIFVSLGYGW